MKLLTPKEASQFKVQYNTPGKTDPFIIKALLKLQLGQSAYVTHSEWKSETKLYHALYPYAKKQDKKFSVLQVKHRLGWIVKRTK